MAHFDFGYLRRTCHDVLLTQRQYQLEVLIDSEDTYLSTLASPESFHIVGLAATNDPIVCHLDVHSGGLHGVEHSFDVLTLLANSSRRTNYGGFWCRTESPRTSVPSGSLNYGWCARLPTTLIVSQESEKEFFVFTLLLIQSFGEMLAKLNDEVAKVGGGTPIRKSDPSGFQALLGGYMPAE